MLILGAVESAPCDIKWRNSIFSFGLWELYISALACSYNYFLSPLLQSWTFNSLQIPQDTAKLPSLFGNLFDLLIGRYLPLASYIRPFFKMGIEDSPVSALEKEEGVTSSNSKNDFLSVGDEKKAPTGSENTSVNGNETDIDAEKQEAQTEVDDFVRVIQGWKWGFVVFSILSSVWIHSLLAMMRY